MDSKSLKKKSKQGAIISLLGFIIVIAVFVFAAMKLNNLNKEIELKESRIDSLTKIQVEQLDSIARQTETIESNKVLVKQLSEDLIRLQL